jgi:hypothetical protein
MFYRVVCQLPHDNGRYLEVYIQTAILNCVQQYLTLGKLFQTSARNVKAA